MGGDHLDRAEVRDDGRDAAEVGAPERSRWWAPARGRQRGGSEDQGARAGEQGAQARERDLEGRVGFLRAGARPAAKEVSRMIDEHRGEFGIEPICRMLQIAPSTYYAVK